MKYNCMLRPGTVRTVPHTRMQCTWKCSFTTGCSGVKYYFNYRFRLGTRTPVPMPVAVAPHQVARSARMDTRNTRLRTALPCDIMCRIVQMCHAGFVLKVQIGAFHGQLQGFPF